VNANGKDARLRRAERMTPAARRSEEQAALNRFYAAMSSRQRIAVARKLVHMKAERRAAGVAPPKLAVGESPTFFQQIVGLDRKQMRELAEGYGKSAVEWLESHLAAIADGLVCPVAKCYRERLPDDPKDAA
jgi:D-serine deaminase-like pyridoxal phosphate-dependent protein